MGDKKLNHPKISEKYHSPEKKTQYERVSITLPSELRNQFEALRNKLNISRSDAIRKAMQLFLTEEIKEDKENLNKNMIGTISYLEKSHIHPHIKTDKSTTQLKITKIADNKNSFSLYNLSKGSLNSISHSEDSAMEEPQHSHPEGLHTHSAHSERSNFQFDLGAQLYTPIEQLEFIKANEIQHIYAEVIVSVMHIHVGPEVCMLILAVNGPYKRIKDLFMELQRLKTIKNIKMDALEFY